MSLFSEADSLRNEPSGIDLLPGRDHRIVWFWRGVFGIAALAAVTGGYYAGHRSSAGEYAAFYQEQKAQVMAGLRDSAARLRTETAAIISISATMRMSFLSPAEIPGRLMPGRRTEAALTLMITMTLLP